MIEILFQMVGGIVAVIGLFIASTGASLLGEVNTYRGRGLSTDGWICGIISAYGLILFSLGVLVVFT